MLDAGTGYVPQGILKETDPLSCFVFRALYVFMFTIL
jgi:hypothetical protein